MKEMEVEVVIDDCNAQLYFEAIYATDTAIRAFHAKVNGDPAAVIGPWSPDGSRTVRFVLPMNVPAMLKKFIGMDAVPVVETQRVEWSGDRGSFSMESEPHLNFPGANKFTTSGGLRVLGQPGGKCLVQAVIRCSAALPWPLQASVEGLMGTEAVASIGTFLNWCKEYYLSWRAEQQLQPERPAPPATPAAHPNLHNSSAAEWFYDACEDEADLDRLPASADPAGATTSTAAALVSSDLVPYTPPRLEDVIVDALRAIQSSTAETAATLRSLEALMTNVDENIQLLRNKLVGHRTARPAATRPQTGAGVAGRSTSSTAAPTGSCTATGRVGMSYLGLLAGVSLVAGTGAVVYIRYRQGLSTGAGRGGK